MAGELEVHYNETSEVEDENKIDGQTGSNNDRNRAPTRNTTKNTTTSAGKMIGESEVDPNNEDFQNVAQLPNRKPKSGESKTIIKKTSCDKVKKRMTNKQNKNN